MTASKPQFGGEKVKLGDVVKASSERNKDGRCSAVYSVTNSQGFIPSKDYFSKEVFSKELKSYRIVKRSMIAYNPSRINVGSVALQDKADEVVVSPLYVVFSVDEERVYPDYVVRFLKSKPGLKQIAFQSIGTVRNNLKFKAMEQMELILPSIDEQQNRLNKLNLVQLHIDKCKMIAEKLDQLVKSRFVEMFGDPIYDRKYQTIKLQDLCSKLGSGATPRGGKSAYKESGTPLIRSMNVHNDRFDRKNLAFIDDAQAEKLKGVTLEKGDVLLNITGASVARSCILPDDLAGGRVNQHVAIIRCDSDRMLPIVLNAILVSGSFQRFLLNGSQMAGATREAITKEDLKKMHVPLPPLKLQQQFADFVAQVDKSGFA